MPILLILLMFVSIAGAEEMPCFRAEVYFTQKLARDVAYDYIVENTTDSKKYCMETITTDFLVSPEDQALKDAGNYKLYAFVWYTKTNKNKIEQIMSIIVSYLDSNESNILKGTVWYHDCHNDDHTPCTETVIWEKQ